MYILGINEYWFMTHIDTDTDLHKRTHTVDIDAYKCLHSDWVSSRESQPLVFPGQFRNKKIPFKKWHSISELHPNCWNMILMITKFTKSFYELQKKTHLLHPACLNFTTHLIGSKKKRTCLGLAVSLGRYFGFSRWRDGGHLWHERCQRRSERGFPHGAAVWG